MVKIMKDTIIVGVGPAGISAAIYLNQLNKDVLVFAKDLGQFTTDDVITTFYGQEPIRGQDLILKGIKQAQDLGIDVRMEAVLSVQKIGSHFEVKTIRDVYEAKTVVLATGKNRIPLKVPGYRDYKGKGIHLCATCDGYFYKKKRVAIIGSGSYMEQELSILENYTDQFIIFTEGDSYQHPTYQTVSSRITSFKGDKRVKQIETKDGNVYDIDGVFLAIGFPTASELSLKLGVVMEYSNILIDENMSTNIKGLFAGGDCTGGKLQIAKSVHDGLKISDGIIKYLRGLTKNGNNQS